MPYVCTQYAGYVQDVQNRYEIYILAIAMAFGME